MSEVVRYITTAGPVALSACCVGTFGLIRLWMRLKFNRYVVDKAVCQGQTIDAAKIIEITTPGVHPHQHSARDAPAQEVGPETAKCPSQDP